eukprot:TRINITY_DN1228_c0_g3_i1.p1 TRINITY_DN1228_c0_g3~~TRINITY_DN1228_c0_g3_i1.p1  ORF type:complete len:284 (+),score=35.32 TRINITY_DN1228_c0_g3_i1:153-1004(+)
MSVGIAAEKEEDTSAAVKVAIRDDCSGKSDDGKGSQLCAICYEDLPAVSLPCSCRVHICTFCWDRSLAESAAARGRPECPTCRTPLKVEYDAAAGLLRFEQDPQSLEPAEWQARLGLEVRSAQVRLLKDCGDAIRADASAAAEGLRCICGGILHRVPTTMRVGEWIAQLPVQERRLIRAGLQGRPVVRCDLCERRVERWGGGRMLWTCTRGGRTVLHLSAHDVCESCIRKYAGRRAVKRLLAIQDGSSLLRAGICCEAFTSSFSRLCGRQPPSSGDRGGYNRM